MTTVTPLSTSALSTSVVAAVAWLLLVAAGLAGCSKAQAKVAPDQPALDVPAPPPRNVEATEPEPLPPAPLAPVGPGGPGGDDTAARPAPARPRQAPPVSPRADPARPEPARADAPPLVEPPRPADDTKGPPPSPLQTTPAGREAQVERGIRDTLASAAANLNRVDYRSLNADARTQYDQAKRFISQAQDALREKNLVFANNLADKANILAAQLAGR